MNTTCNTSEFFTDKWHYTIIDAPGRRDFTNNIIKGSSQADAALILVPADRKFTTTTDTRYQSAGEIQEQTRQRSRPSNLPRMKQTYNDANEMDCGTVGCKHGWCEEISNENFNVRCSTHCWFTPDSVFFLYKQFHLFCLWNQI